MLGQAIYESFANADVSGLAQSGMTTTRLARQYEFRTPELASLCIAMDPAWQGEAAGRARRGAGPLVIRHLLTTPQISNAATSIQQQVEAFQTAKISVVPVPPVPEKPGFFDNVRSLGGANGDYEKQLTAVQNANDHNVAVMTQYENTTRQNAFMLTEIPPALQKLPPLRDDNSQEPPGPGSPIPRPTPRRIPPPGGGRSAGTSQNRTTTTPQPQFPSDSSTTDTDLDQTRPESVQTVPSGVTTPDIGPSKSTPVPSPDGSRSGLPFGPISAGYGPGTDPTRRGIPGGPRESGAFGGPRGAGGGEPGARGIGARGAPVAEGAAGRGTTGRAGAPGAGGPVGGAKGSGSEEDYEHQRPAFLVEADPDELFGNNEPTAPPVIGG